MATNCFTEGRNILPRVEYLLGSKHFLVAATFYQVWMSYTQQNIGNMWIVLVQLMLHNIEYSTANGEAIKLYNFYHDCKNSQGQNTLFVVAGLLYLISTQYIYHSLSKMLFWIAMVIIWWYWLTGVWYRQIIHSFFPSTNFLRLAQKPYTAYQDIKLSIKLCASTTVK